MSTNNNSKQTKECKNKRQDARREKRNYDKYSNRNASKRTNRPQSSEKVEPTAGKRSNSPDWYKIDDNIMKGVASYPFSHRSGDSEAMSATMVDIDTAGTATTTAAYTHVKSPGVMTIEWVPTIGRATSPTDPINQIAQRVYNFVRHANSGSSAYDASDLMMYILSVTSCFNWWCTLRRLYGVLRWASPMNRYLPSALVHAMGFNYEEISMHPTRLLDLINFMAVRMKSFCVPAGMTAVIRQAWLNSNIFTDGMEEKAQYYIPIQRGYYVLKENFELGTPGLLEAKQYWTFGPGYGAGFDKLESFTHDLVNPLLTSEDFMTMGGDIRKAFGVENLFWLESTPVDFTVVPDYNPEVLYQIENSVCPFVTNPTDDFLSKFQITQDAKTNTIKSTLTLPKVKGCSIITYSEALLNMPMDAPSPEDVTVATRLMSMIYYNSVSKDVSIETCGTEIVVGYRLVQNPELHPTLGQQATPFTSFIKVKDTGSDATVGVVGAIMAFSHHPHVYLGMEKDAKIEWTAPLTNLQNWTIVSKEDLDRINTMCLYAEYNVPGMQD